MKKIKFFTLGWGICFTTLIFLGCSKDQKNLENADRNTSPVMYEGKVTMQNSAFNPQEMYVREKGAVLWVNNDNIAHTVTADKGPFDSGDLQPGATFSYTFNTKGDYPYHCKYHPEMVGIIKAVVIMK